MYSPVVSDVADDDLLFTDDANCDSFDSKVEDDSHPHLAEKSPKSSLPVDSFADDLLGDSSSSGSLGGNSFRTDSSGPAGPSRKVLVVGSGDTLSSVLSGIGIKKSEIHEISKAASTVFNLKNLKIGQEVSVDVSSSSAATCVLRLTFKVSDLIVVLIEKRKDGRFAAKREEIPTKKVMRAVSGMMDPLNPLSSLQSAGVKRPIAIEAVKAVNQVVNLRSSRGLVSFEFLYRDYYSVAENSVVKSEFVYASALVNGKIFKTYKFSNGVKSEYVDQSGTILSTCVRSNSLLSQPLNRMKVTSGYGYRIHPIRGFSRRHTGIDLKAPHGTPIFAAASGVVVKAGYYSGYGKYVKIRHNKSIETAYGHMSQIIVRSGQSVRQGQIIGYVGCSGSSTGSHLHYEVIKGGSFINPLSFVKQEPQTLSPTELVCFDKLKKDINLQIVGLVQNDNKSKNALKVKKIS
jgi:murein DD-endopeptidase MepM/ murein hydrolase activator NlpD